MGKKRIAKRFSKKVINNAKVESVKLKNKKNLKKLIRQKNPDIFEFTVNSTFIYESRLSYSFYKRLNIKSIMKPSLEEKQILDSLIAKPIDNSTGEEMFVLPFFKILLENIKIITPKKDIKAQIIEEILKERNIGEIISLKKIKQEFDKKASIRNIKLIQKTSIYNIMKNTLGYKFLKTTVKNSKLAEKNSIRDSFFFLKIILRAITMGLEIIFIDESGFFTQNNHFRCWRKNSQEIYNHIRDNQKVNLIMAVNSYKICHYKLNDNSTTSHEFKKFMEELISKLTEEEKKKVFLFLII